MIPDSTKYILVLKICQDFIEWVLVSKVGTGFTKSWSWPRFQNWFWQNCSWFYTKVLGFSDSSWFYKIDPEPCSFLIGHGFQMGPSVTKWVPGFIRSCFFQSESRFYQFDCWFNQHKSCLVNKSPDLWLLVPLLWVSDFVGLGTRDPVLVVQIAVLNFRKHFVFLKWVYNISQNLCMVHEKTLNPPVLYTNSFDRSQITKDFGQEINATKFT